MSVPSRPTRVPSPAHPMTGVSPPAAKTVVVAHEPPELPELPSARSANWRGIIIAAVAITTVLAGITLAIVAIVTVANRKDGETGSGSVAADPVYRIGDKIDVGYDLVLKVVSINSEDIIGQRMFQFGRMQATWVHVSVANKGSGRIREWNGLHGVGHIDDEHGNRFDPINVSNWQGLPNNDTWNPMAVDDRRRRVDPACVYEGVAYFQYVPKTSKTITLTTFVNGQTIKVSGSITNRIPLTKKD